MVSAPFRDAISLNRKEKPPELSVRRLLADQAMCAGRLLARWAWPPNTTEWLTVAVEEAVVEELHPEDAVAVSVRKTRFVGGADPMFANRRLDEVDGLSPLAFGQPVHMRLGNQVSEV